MMIVRVSLSFSASLNASRNSRFICDVNAFRAWGRLRVFDAFEPRARPYAAGAAYLRGQGSGKVKSVSGLKEVFTQHGDIVVEHRIPATGQPEASSYEGEGYVIVRHPETEVVHRALKAIIDQVRVVLG